MDVLLISSNKDMIKLFSDTLNEEIVTLVNKSQILKHTPEDDYKYIFCDYEFLSSLPFKENDYSVSSATLGYHPQKTKLILLLTKNEIPEAIFHIRSGGLNYITYPVTEEEIAYNCQSKLNIIQNLNKDSWIPDNTMLLRTANPLVNNIYDQLKLVAQKSTTVLITGETGTGKNIVAKLLHQLSDRRDKPFISLNCSALPETLLESELFGHEKGSFTGAIRQKKGKFELADNGTIFLDEIGTISKDIQVKLLQVLQERNITRIGGDKSIDLNIRVIAATNEDLSQLCKDGLFRYDLYYRLNIFPIHMPALRERVEDLSLICSTIINRFNTLHGKSIQNIAPLVLEAFKSYSWPGNIRELENLIERAFILEESDTITRYSIPAEILANAVVADESDNKPQTGFTLAEIRKEAVERIEEEYIKSSLSTHKGKIKDTADAAGITTRQLHKLMTKYNLNKSDYK